MQFFPRNINFYNYFDALAEQLTEANAILSKIDKKKALDDQAEKIKVVEHKADQITHEIFNTLNQTFITPIDREDIVDLVSRLDDVIDAMDRTVNRMQLYNVATNTSEITQYIKLLDKAIHEIVKAFDELKRSDKGRQAIIKHCEIINFIENQVDELNTRVIGELFKNHKDAIEIIKLKEVYESFESIADRCEDVANVLETIVVKYQ